MALNGDVLGLLMLANVNALSEAQKRDRTAVYRALGSAIVDHITANAVVTVASVTLVQPGLGSSGPGAGTIS